MLFTTLVPRNVSLVILVTSALSRPTGGLLEPSLLMILLCTDPRSFRARCTRASAAAICSINELPASVFANDPTAATDKPSAWALQTQSGARFFVLGNRHLA